MSKNLFEYVKSNIKISQYVQSLPQFKGMNSTGMGRYRCNNVIANGTNTNAMSIDDETGFFKAFSHGNESGDVITLHGLISGLSDSPKEAALDLASTMGLSIPDEILESNRGIGDGISRKKMIETLNSIMEKTHGYLVNSDDEDAVRISEYLYDRGLSDTLRDEWMLGALPSDESKARKMLLSCGDKRVLRKIGMYGGKSGDFISMRGRLLFPIFSKHGECVSFSSRTVPDVYTPMDSKYVNTSNTDVYDKSKTLYGQHLISKETTKAIICEGNFDVIALNEMAPNHTTALATCGTALTQNHIGELKRSGIKEIMIVFDSDKAGRKAAASLSWITNFIAKTGIFESNYRGDPWDMYMSGKNFNFEYQQPLVVTASKMMAKDLARDDFSDWFKTAYAKLNFVDDQQLLLSSAAEYAGMKERYLRSLVTTNNSQKRSRQNPKELDVTTSDTVTIVCAALLSLGMKERKLIAFPLYNKKMQPDAFDVCGAQTEEDEEAIKIALGGYRSNDETLSSYVYSLLPNEDEEEVALRQAVIVLSKNLQHFFTTYGALKSKNMFKYIAVLSTISSGASSAPVRDQLIFIFDLVSSLHTI